MDLAEIRKKARQQQAEQGGEALVETVLPAELLDDEEDQEFTLPPSVPQAPRTQGFAQLFPDLSLATEEDYIQGISGRDRESEEETVQWLTFFLGKEEYALPLQVVLELIKPRPYTDLPKVPAYVRGILSLRGEVVPVVDLCQRLQLGSSTDGAAQRIVVCEGKEQSIGLLVDRITQVIRVPKAGIEPPPLILNEKVKDFVAGVGRFQGRMLIQLNPEEVLKISTAK